MKRIAILLAVVAMFASTATIALADDDVDTDDETGEERELNGTQQEKAKLLAKFLLYDYAEDREPIDESGDEPTPEELAAATEAAAAELDEAAEAIAALRTGETEVGVVGWGAIFKLIQLYKLQVEGEDGDAGADFATMLQDFGDEGWAFGKHFKALRDDGRKSPKDAPKNFGQLKKLEREANASQDD